MLLLTLDRLFYASKTMISHSFIKQFASICFAKKENISNFVFSFHQLYIDLSTTDLPHAFLKIC